MKKKTPAPIAALAAVLSMQEITKLSVKDACQKFAEKATVSQRAFAEMGKLHHAISAGLRKGQTIYGELRKMGVKDSTIGNAAYASRVWDAIIAPGHLKESHFDGFTFADCLAITRAMGEKSSRRLSGEEVAVIVQTTPETFDAELESIFASGLTVEEAEAQAKAEADRTAAAAKAEEQRKNAEITAKAEADARAKLAAEQSQTNATPPPTVPQTPPPVTAQNTSEESENTETGETAEPPAPQAPGAQAAPPSPANIVSIPPQNADPDAMLPEVLDALDNIYLSSSEMSIEARKAIFNKFNEIMGLIGETLTAEVAVAA